MQGNQLYQPKLFVQIDLDSLIPKNHILRKIDKLIDLSFVRDLTRQYYCHNNGRPSIDPELFFRMVLIGYIFDISSDRKLCEELKYNLAYRWFCKLNIDDFTPDHSSISRIRDRYDYEVFSLFFDKIVSLCKEAGLVKGKKIITDSTLIAANASLDSMVNKTKLEEKSSTGNTVKHPTVRKLLNQTHISKTDPESSLARNNGSARGLKYKAHISIDADSRVILDNKITAGSCHESTIYKDRIIYLRGKYDLDIKEVVADSAYGTFDNISWLNEHNITTYIPLFSGISGKAHQLELQGFSYDKENDYYKCLAGQKLKGVKSGNIMMYYIRISDCQNCEVIRNCQAKKRTGKKWRVVYRSLQQDFFENQLHRIQLPEFQSALKERMWKIEGINSESKNQHGLRRARYRGLKKMQIQADMVASVLNIKRLLAYYDVIYCITTICIMFYNWLEQNKEKYIILITQKFSNSLYGFEKIKLGNNLGN